MIIEHNRSHTIKEIKLEELSGASNAVIVAGFEHVDGEHYSMTIEDQMNILTLSLSAAQGSSVLYHADGKPCRVYSAQDFSELAQLANAHITYHTTYFNMLKQWVLRTETVEGLLEITYGAQLPEDLASAMTEILNLLWINSVDGSQFDKQQHHNIKEES
jgi:hypothetical protein